jgi:hypothetical protein
MMLKAGGNIDSWCGTCKMMLAHTIEAMVGEKPARVHCNTCNAQHGYKARKPGETTRKPRVAKAGEAPRVAKPRANKYQTLLNSKDAALTRRYSPSEKYALGEVMEHPSFGVGVVTAIKDGTKIEILFEGGMKLLVHGR